MATTNTDADVDDDEFLDPITFDVIVDPEIGNDGCTCDRSTAYELMTKGSVMPGCREPFKLGADNVHFRSRLRRAHPHTEQLMRQQREDSLQVQSYFASYLTGSMIVPVYECLQQSGTNRSLNISAITYLLLLQVQSCQDNIILRSLCLPSSLHPCPEVYKPIVLCQQQSSRVAVDTC